MTGFPNKINVNPAHGLPGDFANFNAYFTALAGPGGLVAGPSGCTVGRFAWLTNPPDADGAPGSVVTGGIGTGGLPVGLIHREGQALIPAYLQETSNLIPAGFPVTVMTGGSFFMQNDGSTTALPGMKAFANYADGTCWFAATGTTASTSATANAYIEAGTFSVTGSISDDVLTVTDANSQNVVVGATLTSGAASGTKITGQLSGTAMGAGTYSLSIPEQTVASTTITGTYGLAHITVLTGTVSIGDRLSGSGITANTMVTQQISGGAGGSGDYATDTSQTAGSSGSQVSTTVYGSIETKWICRSTGLAGEVVKVEDHA